MVSAQREGFRVAGVDGLFVRYGDHRRRGAQVASRLEELLRLGRRVAVGVSVGVGGVCPRLRIAAVPEILACESG